MSRQLLASPGTGAPRCLAFLRMLVAFGKGLELACYRTVVDDALGARMLLDSVRDAGESSRVVLYFMPPITYLTLV